MRGTNFEAENHRLAGAYALIRPNGSVWLAAWQAGDAWAADELSEWELEGHLFQHTSWSTTDMMTVTEVLDGMLAIYTTPGTWTRDDIAKDAAGQPVPADSSEVVAWSLEGALERVIGDLECGSLLSDACEACRVDLASFSDTARHQRVVVSVLEAGRDYAATCSRQL
ncbi:hypothetical protein ACLBWX_01180 [Methylobacterium sp. M6A4_1b]